MKDNGKEETASRKVRRERGKKSGNELKEGKSKRGRERKKVKEEGIE